MLLAVACSLATMPAGPAIAAGRMFHVAPNGSDSAPGTADKPFATVTHGLEALRAGDTLLLHDGRYVENITNARLAHGTRTARITVAAAPGARPVIKGLLWLRQPNFWTVEGLTVRWAASNPSTRHMVKITGGRRWTVRNSTFSGAQSYAGLLVVGHPDFPGEPANWRVTRNCIHSTAPSNDTNQDHLIYVNTGTSAGHGRIVRNLLFDAPNGSGVKLGGPSATEGGAAGVDVRYNTVHRTAQPIFVAWQSRNNEIERNLLVGAGPNYAGIRSYQLAGGRNVARSNVVGATKGVFLHDHGYGRVADGGGNVDGIHPGFDRVGTCGGYRSTDPVARTAGHRGGRG